jgi:hypothetical protein
LEVEIAGTTKNDFSAETEEGMTLPVKARQTIAANHGTRKGIIKLAP